MPGISAHFRLPALSQPLFLMGCVNAKVSVKAQVTANAGARAIAR